MSDDWDGPQVHYVHWSNGCPRANSPQHARELWAPHLPEWGRRLEHYFWSNTCAAPESARLGWIDDAEFWRALWAGVEACTQDVSAKVGRIGPFVREAGRIGNLVPFEALPNNKDVRIQARAAVMADDALLSQSVVDWFDAQDKLANPGGVDAPMRSMLLNLQDHAWARVQWQSQSLSSPILRRWAGPLDMEEALSFIGPALAIRPDSPFVHVHALGHLMANAPSAWFRPDGPDGGLVQVLVKRLGPMLHPSVDVPLVALCSGYGPNTNDVLKSIKRLGQHLTQGHTSTMGKKVQAAELEVLRNLYELTDPYALYDVLRCTGLHKGTVQPTLPLDGLLDGPGLG